MSGWWSKESWQYLLCAILCFILIGPNIHIKITFFFSERKMITQRYIFFCIQGGLISHTRSCFLTDDYFKLCWSNHFHQKIPSASSTAPAGDVAFYCGRWSEFSKDPQLRHAAALERSSCERSSCSRQLVAVEAPRDTGCGSFSPFLPYIALCPSNSILLPICLSVSGDFYHQSVPFALSCVHIQACHARHAI